MFSFFRKKRPARPQLTDSYKGLQLPTAKREGGAPDPNSFLMMMQRLQRNGVEFNSVIDVGASDGRWTELLLRRFPEPRYHLLEPKPEHQAALEEFAGSRPNVSVSNAAAGRQVGRTSFLAPAEDPFGGRAAEGYPLTDAQKQDVIEVAATTIDEEVSRNELEAPFLIKLDTHGHEIPILEGARRTLSETNVLILELYNLRIGADCLLFWEMCQQLAGLGFRPWDLFDLVRRESDEVFWQFDAVFLRDDHTVFREASSRATG